MLKKWLVKMFSALVMLSAFSYLTVGSPVNGNPLHSEIENNTLATPEATEHPVGLLLAFAKSDRRMEEDEEENPVFVPEAYKSIWIASDGTEVKFKQKDGFAIAPGPDGFYKVERLYGKMRKAGLKIEVDKIITYKTGSEPKRQIDIVTDHKRFFSSEVFNIEFIGNNFVVISNSRVYTTGAGGYQYRPTIRVCKLGYTLPAEMENKDGQSGLISFKDIIPVQFHAEIDRQITAYKVQFDKAVKVESEHDMQYISENDLTLRRKEGKWKLFVPVKFSNWKYSHNALIDFKEIECPLPDDLVSYNELCMPFDEIKESIPDVKDAVSSPDNSMIIVQTSDKLKVYANPLKGLVNLVLEIPISQNEKIILNQWCTGKHVGEWDEELTKLLK